MRTEITPTGTVVDVYRVHFDVLDDYLREQDGVITLAQARSCRPESSTPSLAESRSGHWRRCSQALYFAA